MAGFRELEFHSKFSRVDRLKRYLERNMRDFYNSYILYMNYYQELKNKLDSFYELDETGKARKLKAADINVLKSMYKHAFEILQFHKQKMQEWAEANNIPQNVINIANTYFDEVSNLFNRDRGAVNALDVRDGLSLPAAIYKNSYEVSHNMLNKDPKFAEYLRIMKTNSVTADELLEKYRKSSPEKIQSDCTKRLEKNPRLYEYVTMPENAIYAANTGNLEIISAYLNEHGDSLTFSQRMKLNKQIDAVAVANVIQTNAEVLMANGEEIGTTPRVFKPSGATDPNACEIDIALPAFQTSSQGCWSCGAQMLIHSRGNKEVTQEHIRDFRTNLSTQEIDANRVLIDSQYNLDNGKNFMNMSDSVLAFAPNSMVHELTIQQYLRPEEKAGISPVSYLENSLKVVKDTIHHAITVDHSPIVFRKPGHHITIVGIDGDKVKYKDSFARSGSTPNETHTASLKEMLSNLLINKNPADRSAVEISWVSDIKLSKDGKTIHGIPSKYTQMNEDGTLVLPPEEIMRDANEANSTGINKNGIRIYRVGGDEDNLLGRNDSSAYSDGGIIKVEKVYMPQRLNAEYLKKMAEKRSMEEENQLESIDKEFWGVDHSLEIVRPEAQNNIDNENNIANEENAAVADNNIDVNDVEVDIPHYSLSDISDIIQNLADELDQHMITYPLATYYAAYDNLSTQLQEIQTLAERGKKSAIRNDGTFGPNEMKRLLDKVNRAIETSKDYLDSKTKDMMNNPEQKLDPSKLKREQPRIRSVISSLDKLMDIRNSLSGNTEPSIYLFEKNNHINNYKAYLVNEGVDKKKQQEDSFKNRIEDSNTVKEQIEKIDAIMGIQPEYLDYFKGKKIFRNELVNGKKVSVFNKIKSVKKPIKAIGSADASDVISSKDFAALSFAASTTRKVYDKFDSKIRSLDENRFYDKETRYLVNSSRLTYNLTSSTNYPLSFYVDNINDSRDFAENALRNYENGNKEPLAALITHGIKHFNIISLTGYYSSGKDLIIYSEMGQRMSAMLDRDPELMKLAVKKGLTGKDISHIRSLETVGRIRDKYNRIYITMYEFAEKEGKNPNWTDEQKLEYYTDYLMGVRFRENEEATELELNENPDYVREINERNKKAREISLNGLNEFYIKIKDALESGYSVNTGFEQLLNEYNREKNQALTQPTDEVKLDKLNVANEKFREKLTEFLKKQEEKLKDYKDQLINELQEEIKTEGLKRGIDIELPENEFMKWPLAIDVKRRQMEAWKKQLEATPDDVEAIKDFANKYEEFIAHEKSAQAIFTCAKLRDDVKRILPNGGTMLYYLYNTKGVIISKYRKKDNLMQQIGEPGKYSNERRRIREFLKGTGAYKLRPDVFYQKMDGFTDNAGKVFHQETKRTEQISNMLKKYEKLKPAEKQQFAAKFAELAEVRQPGAQRQAGNAVRKNNKEVQNRNMIKAFYKNALKFIKMVEKTYGKNKSDSKPSSLMQSILKGLKGFTPDMSLEEFSKKLDALQKSVNNYTDKRGFPKKADRVERIESLFELNTEINKTKQEMESIKNGKGGRIHSIHLGNETKGNKMTADDLKKNLIAFTASMLSAREFAVIDLPNYDPHIPRPDIFQQLPVPPEPEQDLKNVMDAMMEWYNLGKPGPDGKGKNLSFDKFKKVVEKLNTASTIWLSTNEMGDTEFSINRYDLVRSVRDNTQCALRNIRAMQPYMDVMLPEGRLGSLNVFDAVKSMPEPYNQIEVIADNTAVGIFRPQDVGKWNTAKAQLKLDKCNLQTKFNKGESLRDHVVTVNFNLSIMELYRYPLSDLDVTQISQENLNARPGNLAYEATVHMFKDKIDQADGWGDLASKYSANEVKNAVMEIAKEIRKTKAFKNIVDESSLFTVKTNLKMEAKKTGDDKKIDSILNKENVERIIRNNREAERVRQAQQANNAQHVNHAPAL